MRPHRGHGGGVFPALRGAVVLVLAATLIAPPARATLDAVYEVPGDFATIQAAIDASDDGDQVLVAPGTYVESIDFGGRAIIVRSSDGPLVTTIDGNGLTVVSLVSGEGRDTRLEGFTITGGGGTPLAGGGTAGGGMLVRDASPTITDCRFVSNVVADPSGAFGGGLFNDDAGPLLIDCAFEFNSATGEPAEGGGVATVGPRTPTFLRCTFVSNLADGGCAAAHGGGIRGRAYVTECTFTGNAALAGGAGCGGSATASGGGISSASAIIRRCDFTGNDVGSNAATGGGVAGGQLIAGCRFEGNTVTNAGPTASGGGGAATNGTVIGCTFVGNTVGPNCIGGGLNGAATVHSSIFRSNAAAPFGGGMYAEVGAVINGCTFTENTASVGGGGLRASNALETVTIVNSIFWNDSSEISGTGAVVTFSDVSGGFTGLGNIDADPQFLDADLRLRRGSACIESGYNVAVDPCITDLGGNSRVSPGTAEQLTGGGLVVDMGAHEFGSEPACTGFALVGEICTDCNDNGEPDVCEIFHGLPDCDNNGVPDACDAAVLDCNANGIPDTCDIDAAISADCDVNGIPDECAIDCDGNGVPDVCELDCNANGIGDACDILDRTSADCNADGIPDECEDDCNGSGQPDVCDIAGGGSLDCNGNGAPDECELDINDCNANGIPDDCEPVGTDCNENGVVDLCEDEDCNANGIIDQCEVADETASDCNGNGVPDICEVEGVCQATVTAAVPIGFGAGVGGLDSGDRFGQAVAAIGDIDGNGVPDLLVGSPGDDDGGPNRGAVRILFMDADGSVLIARKISSTFGGFSGVLDDGDEFGRSVALLGDLSDDGLTEIAVGAMFDDDGGQDHGAVWIISLNPDGSVAAHSKISSTEGGMPVPLDTTDRFAISCAGLGDLDDDGVEDLAVGVYSDDDGSQGGGAVYIFRLNANGTVKAFQKISDLAGGFAGDLETSDFFGRATVGLGDLDGDGVPDLASGSYADDGGFDRGGLWILYLNSNGTVKDYQKISATAGGLLDPLDDEDHFSEAVELIGDLDGDGIVDLAVGAYGDDDGGANRGSVHILYLNVDGTVRSSRKISAIAGDLPPILADGDEFGYGLAATDLDNDGLIELSVGALHGSGIGSDEGRLWVLSLGGCAPDEDMNGLPDECDPEPLEVSCPADTNGSGTVDVDDLITIVIEWSCRGQCAGDVNGDEVVDVDDLIAVLLAWGDC